MKQKLRQLAFSALGLWLSASALSAQGVGINDDNTNPDPSAMLDVKSSNKGTLIPRVALSSTAVAAPVAAPATSLLVYNTQTAGDVTPGFYYWNGTIWVRFQTGTASNDWALLGNAGTNPALNFIGTTDNQPLVTRTNGAERMRVLANGNVGINTTTPAGQLVVATNFGAGVNRGAWVTGHINGNNGVILGMRKSRGTEAAPAAVAANDYAGCIVSHHHDGSSYLLNGYIGYRITGAAAAGSIPGEWFLSASNANDNDPYASGTVRMVVQSTGNVGIGITAPAERLHVGGNVRTSSLAGVGTRLVSSDANGTLTNFATGTNGQMLSVVAGTPTWTNNLEWSISGNANTTDGTHFLGTTNSVPLTFRVNNQRAARVDHLTSNAFFGYLAGNLSTGTENTATGTEALALNTSGAANTSAGYRAMRNNTTGGFNTAFGHNALAANTTSSINVAIGTNALAANTAAGNVAVGYNALTSNTTGNGNTAVGTSALGSNTTGTNNTALGSSALSANQTGTGNIAVGIMTLINNTTGNNNIGIGQSSLITNTAGIGNIGVGTNTLYNSTGSQNIAIGTFAMQDVSTGNFNIAIGGNANRLNTAGGSNIVIGQSAMGSSTAGSNNIAIGISALSNSTGSSNIGIGGGALFNVTTGTNNLGLGSSTLNNYSTASQNTAIGNGAMSGSVVTNTGGNNTAVGYNALRTNETGTGNTVVGTSAGLTNTTGSNNTLIGISANVSANNLTNATAIGANATVAASNSMVLGNNANVGIGTNNPVYGKLQVVGNSIFSLTAGGFTGGSAAYIRGRDGFSTPTTPDYTWWNSDQTGLFHPAGPVIGFCVNGFGEVMRIQDNRVGIATTTPGGAFELGIDQGRKPGTNVWTIPSDERLKTIHGSYNKGLSELMQLQPIRYTYKNAGGREFHTDVLATEQIGFSAQNVQGVFPEAVGKDDDGFLNLNTHAILVAYLNAIKQLHANNEQLKADNAALRQRLEALEQENAGIRADVESIKTLLQSTSSQK